MHPSTAFAATAPRARGRRRPRKRPPSLLALLLSVVSAAILWTALPV